MKTLYHFIKILSALVGFGFAVGAIVCFCCMAGDPVEPTGFFKGLLQSLGFMAGIPVCGILSYLCFSIYSAAKEALALEM